MKGILVVVPDRNVVQVVRGIFRSRGTVDAADDLDACLGLCRKKRYELALIDLALLQALSSRHGQYDYKSSLQQLWQIQPALEIIVMAGQDAVREAVMAVKAGASNYVTYPLNRDEVRYAVELIAEENRTRSELDYLRSRFWQADALEVVQTKNAFMRSVFEAIRLVAPTKSTVLLTGETGTGKGILAKLIHCHSNRKDVQFIGVHCGAIPDTLLESELFGHEKGAFTGAVRRKLGKFELAHGGTIFLDEIGTLSPAAQIRLLQILQDRTYERVGGEETLEADVRIVAASNVDLKKTRGGGPVPARSVYRLNVFPIELPPLRERTEDIPQLVEVFLRNLNRFNQKDIHYAHPQVMDAFRRYPWPGNIRELENLVERAYILETSSMLTPESFPAELFTVTPTPPRLSLNTSLTLGEVRRQAVEAVERQYLKELLSVNRGRIDRTAVAAGVTGRQIHKLLQRHEIRKEDFK